MIVCWSEQKKGYIICRAERKIPLYINDEPVIGYFASAFINDERNETPATQAFESLFSKVIKRVYNSGESRDGKDYYYEKYVLKLLGQKITITVHEVSECYYMDYYTIKLEVEVAFKGETILEKELEFSEGETSGDINKELSLLLTNFLYFYTQANDLNDDLIMEFEKHFAPEIAKKLIQQYSQFMSFSDNEENEEVLFYTIRYCSGISEGKKFFLEPNRLVKKNNTNTYNSPKRTTFQSKSCVISDIFEDSSNGLKTKHIFIGEYPQSALTYSEREISQSLELITNFDNDGYKNYKGSKYLLVKTGPFKNRNTYFKVSPLKFKILYETEDKILVISEKIIDKYNHNYFFNVPTNNEFILKMFLPDFTFKLFNELIKFAFDGDKTDFGVHGLNLNSFEYNILVNAMGFIREKSPQSNDPYLGRWNDADDFWRDYDRFVPIFSQIKPVYDELSEILSDSIDELGLKSTSFLISLKYKDYLSEELGFKEGQATKYIYSYGWEDKSRQALMTEYAKEQDARNIYHYSSESGSYILVEGEKGTIYKRKEFDRDIKLGFRPVLILQKKCIGKTISLVEKELEWNDFSLYRNEVNKDLSDSDEPIKMCRICDSVLENGRWCHVCEDFTNVSIDDEDSYDDYDSELEEDGYDDYDSELEEEW